MKVLLTGANRGIGLELAKLIVARGDELTCLVRKTSDELGKLNCKIIDGIDFSNDDFLTNLEEISSNYDLAIFNAGVGYQDELPLNLKAITNTFTINSFSQVILADRLLPKFNKSGKMAFISSIMGSIEENTSGNFYAYRASKTALNSLVKCLSFDSAKKDVTSFVLHPGYVQTDMTGNTGDINANTSAQNILDSIEVMDEKMNGLFFHTREKRVIPW